MVLVAWEFALKEVPIWCWCWSDCSRNHHLKTISFYQEGQTFHKGPDSTYFWLCRPQSFCCKYSTLPLPSSYVFSLTLLFSVFSIEFNYFQYFFLINGLKAINFPLWDSHNQLPPLNFPSRTPLLFLVLLPWLNWLWSSNPQRNTPAETHTCFPWLLCPFACLSHMHQTRPGASVSPTWGTTLATSYIRSTFELFIQIHPHFSHWLARSWKAGILSYTHVSGTIIYVRQVLNKCWWMTS